MKLFIFRCRATPKMFGATRYETASNLPTDACTGGWVFHEQVNLSPRSTLRFGVDTSVVRRYVRQRGWHVWYESGALRPEPVEKLPRSPWYEEPPAEERESVSWEEATEYSSGEEATESALNPPERWDSPEESEPVTAHKPMEADLELRLEPAPEPEPEPEPQPRHAPAAARVRESSPLRDTQPVQEAPVRPSPPLPPPAPPAPPRVSRAPVRQTFEEARPAAVRHQVSWFDIPVRDIDRAVRFYSAVLGFTLKKEQAGPGAAIAALPHSEGSIGGSLVQNMDAKPSDSGPLLYLNADGRLDEALMAVEKLGGKVLAEKHSIAPFGFRAVVLDSEGNRIALHSM